MKTLCKLGFHSLVRNKNYDVVCINCKKNISKEINKEFKSAKAKTDNY